MLFLKNLKVWNRLALGFNCLGLALLAVVASAWWGLRWPSDAANEIHLEMLEAVIAHRGFQNTDLALDNLFTQERGLGVSTILGSGEATLILDVPQLIQLASESGQRRRPAALPPTV